ncbi:MAG: FHA domain-containing protein [Spirochaetales bacterium]|nr:FHA domain-containing protein [Spirochaetales bacterium]
MTGSGDDAKHWDKHEADTILSGDRRKVSSTGVLRRRGVLVVVSRDGFGSSFVVRKSDMIIGRRGDCDISLEDELLSRQHCRITVDDKGNFHIEDLSSTNATWLNSEKLKEKSALRYGDRILIGNTILRFFLEEEVEKR